MKDENDDFVTYAALVNRECERFKLKEMTDDQFKSLIFVCGLKSPREADIRKRILSKLEIDPNITLQSISEECQRLINLKHDTAEIERQLPVTLVNAVKHNTDQRGKMSQLKQADHSQRPKTSCRQCGEWHFVKFCPFKNRYCYSCGRRDHKQSHCRSRLSNQVRSKSSAVFSTKASKFSARRKFINILINDVAVKVQVDTASDITIICYGTWKRLGCPEIMPTSYSARNASGTEVQLAGEVKCNVSLGTHLFEAICYVIES